MIRILCLGDVVGEEGVRMLEQGGRLRKLITDKKADLTIVNGENSATSGATPVMWSPI